jgi:hypothetical protein
MARMERAVSSKPAADASLRSAHSPLLRDRAAPAVKTQRLTPDFLFGGSADHLRCILNNLRAPRQKDRQSHHGRKAYES